MPLAPGRRAGHVVVAHAATHDQLAVLQALDRLLAELEHVIDHDRVGILDVAAARPRDWPQRRKSAMSPRISRSVSSRSVIKSVTNTLGRRVIVADELLMEGMGGETLAWPGPRVSRYARPRCRPRRDRYPQRGKIASHRRQLGQLIQDHPHSGGRGREAAAKRNLAANRPSASSRAADG